MPSVAGIVRRRHNRKQRRQQQRSRGRLWSGIGGLLLVLLVLVPLLAVAAVSLVLYGRAAATLVDSPDTLAESTAAGTTRLYDRSGQTLLFSISDAAGSGPPPTLAQLPPYVWQATLLMQDADFLQQPPPGPIDTLTRLWRYVLGLPPLPDTSLTGQLVSNALLPRARHSGLDDALLQLVLTAEVSRRYTPEQILGWYLNTAYYGKDAYGIDAAARLYLGKDAAGLALDEAALLAAIPRAPEYNPYDDEASARGRQTNLLRDLLGNGLITQPDFEAAINRFTPLRVDLLQLPQAAPEFALYAREQAEDILNGLGLSGARLLARGGLRITTTLDMDLYHQAECVLRAHLAQVAGARPADLTTLDGAACAAAAYLAVPEGPIDAASPPDTGSLLLLNTENGEILALVGAVVAGQHPPGMMLAPFVYLEGILSGGFTPATMLLDVPQPFPGSADGLIYTPISMDRRFRGPLLLRDALAGGLLPPAVFVADSGGMSDVLFVAHRMGLNTLADSSSDLSLLERGGAVSLLDLTYAYSVLASGGQMIGVDVEPAARNDRARNPVAILKIAVGIRQPPPGAQPDAHPGSRCRLPADRYAGRPGTAAGRAGGGNPGADAGSAGGGAQHAGGRCPRRLDARLHTAAQRRGLRGAQR
ncbi:MAG: transglycosylase domain-containing protein [Anaerolineae bacterium]|nr:transglycosylase domain-containing protein [Anaerolineae bacterium]